MNSLRITLILSFFFITQIQPIDLSIILKGRGVSIKQAMKAFNEDTETHCFNLSKIRSYATNNVLHLKLNKIATTHPETPGLKELIEDIFSALGIVISQKNDVPELDDSAITALSQNLDEWLPRTMALKTNSSPLPGKQSFRPYARTK